MISRPVHSRRGPEIRIVLVRPSEPRNVGAAARAMKAMGLEDLVLVSPLRHPAPEAEVLSRHSRDVLRRARVVRDLPAALGDCDFVAGTTRRQRTVMKGHAVTPRAMVEELLDDPTVGRAAILFGPERIGLSNGELALCHRIVTIPIARHQPSLNLAQAVMVLAYEIHLGRIERREEAAREVGTRGGAPPGEEGGRPATADQLEAMYEHLDRALAALAFPAAKAGVWRERFRFVLQRARLRSPEVNLLRTLARQIIRRSGQGKKSGAPPTG